MTTQTTVPTTITDLDLRARIARDFGSRGGVTRLAAALGVTVATGCAMLEQARVAAVDLVDHFAKFMKMQELRQKARLF